MPGIFLTTNVFAHVGGLFFSLSFTRKKACKESEQSRRLTLALIGRADKPPFMGTLPPYPRSLQTVGCSAAGLGKQIASGCLQTK